MATNGDNCGQCAGGGSLDHTSQLQSPVGSERQDVGPMADLNSSLESSGLSADETSTSAAAHSVASSCETMMWEGWTSQPGSTGDDASTSALQLPELAASSTSRLSFHHQSDMLSTMLSHFHPLAHHGEPDGQEDHSPGFLHEGDFQSPAESDATVTSFGGNSAKNGYLSGIPCPLPKREDLSHFLYAKSTPATPQLQMWQSLGPESPSSPLALNHNGSRHSQGDGTHVAHVPWPGATSSATMQLLQDSAEHEDTHAKNHFHALQSASQASKKLELFSFSNSTLADRHQFHGDHPSRISIPTAHNVHSEIHVHNNFSSLQQPTWTTSSPEASIYSLESGRTCSTRSQQFMNFVRIAQEQRPVDHNSDPDSVHARSYGDCTPGKGGSRGSEQTRTGKYRQQLPGGEESSCPPPKRPHLQAVDHGAALWRNAHGHRSLYSPSAASQAMEIFAIGPALNTNGKPRARRGSATDPQSVYARHRREKINERLKILQHLVPNGAKVDIVTMLDEAVHYVQFLQLQVKLLKSDKYWIHATPNTYKGIDLTNPPTQMQGLGSSA